MRGYRDDGLFGDGITDPLEVIYHETYVLGNCDIVETIVTEYSENLTEEELLYLNQIIAMNQGLDTDMSEIDKPYFQDILKKVLNDRNYCLWLCEKPEDVYESYVEPMSGDDGVTYDEYKEDISEYDVPEDALILSDLGSEGSLYVWKKG